jgi:hypothetical protein
MVDKKSLRSNKRSDASSNSRSSSSNNNNPSKPTRASSRKTASGSLTKKTGPKEPEKEPEKTMSEKKDPAPVEDVQMSDVQTEDDKKDNTGDLEMEEVSKDNEGDKTGDGKVGDGKAVDEEVEVKEDPSTAAVNGIDHHYIKLV